MIFAGKMLLSCTLATAAASRLTPAAAAPARRPRRREPAPQLHPAGAESLLLTAARPVGQAGRVRTVWRTAAAAHCDAGRRTPAVREAAIAGALALSCMVVGFGVQDESTASSGDRKSDSVARCLRCGCERAGSHWIQLRMCTSTNDECGERPTDGFVAAVCRSHQPNRAAPAQADSTRQPLASRMSTASAAYRHAHRACACAPDQAPSTSDRDTRRPRKQGSAAQGAARFIHTQTASNMPARHQHHNHVMNARSRNAQPRATRAETPLSCPQPTHEQGLLPSSRRPA